MKVTEPDPLVRLAGWGNFPVETCHVAQPSTLRELQATIQTGHSRDYISRGLGRAYGDSALNAGQGVVVQTRLNRFLALDAQRGALTCEAGVSFAEIIAALLPRGWFLPVTPGTRYVTVGGAIAADVHGKNHHVDGSFGNFIEQLDLLTANGQIVICSPNERAELFWATVGGMGLTGCVVRARFRLRRVETAYIRLQSYRSHNLDETLERFVATNASYPYSVAWIDCLATGKTLGRSVLTLGEHATPKDLDSARGRHPLALPPRRLRNVPFQFPSGVLNSFAVRAFNSVYFQAHRDGERIVDLLQFFFPLDGIEHWNRIYGRRGFAQYQALFPPETARAGLVELLGKLASKRCASFLAVLKSTGPATPGLLSYAFPGYTLALDMPHRGAQMSELAADLDQIVLRHGGRLYLAKDSLMTPETFQQMYPTLKDFQAIKTRVDPNQRFVSSQARRLAIVES